MGVPKFYRWISERYPCLSQVIRDFQIPEFDNLYMDMNGIIHICSHPEDDNPHFRISEKDIFASIFHYLEFLFRMIKPRKVFFMAVDGVAPRAKMNQQRGRRFRSAREALTLVKQAEDRGEILPTEKRFDSNCITPGTEFMARLHEQLEYFVVQKVSTDPLWQGVKIYLSGHETPGEGEHKIMDYIRSIRANPNYDPNTRHCLYGLDADLIMLGLASHEPHFSLLREEVRFSGKRDKNKRPATPEETTFHLLHLSLMREYLEYEFFSLKDKLSFPYDLERIIDDWILMSFLVGNDFIPNLPHLHIHHDALPFLWQTYIEVLPSCNDYLNDGGVLNLKVFESYLAALSEYDFTYFEEHFSDVKWLAGKFKQPLLAGAGSKLQPSSKKKEPDIDDDSEFSDLVGMEGSEEYDQMNLIAASVNDDLDVCFNEEFRNHKKKYYSTKMECEEITEDFLKDQAHGYVTAIQWILLYYFQGVPSWSWYYRYHYAPYISDVRNFKDIVIKMDMGTPFLPFQQLMAVLPTASKDILPLPLQDLMTMDDSPVRDFYPEDFKTDLNGKAQEWEAVVLIPFIDEDRLIKAMKTCESRLTAEEKARNKHGPCLMYEFSSKHLGKCKSAMPNCSPDVLPNLAQLTRLSMDVFNTPSDCQKRGLLKGIRQDVYFPGFPTLKHIKHRAELKRDGVKVFQSNSHGENMILQIMDDSEPDVQTVAHELLGKTISVAWPHFYLASVVQISDDLVRFKLADSGKDKKNARGHIIKEMMSEQNKIQWHQEVNAIADRYHDRCGVDIGPTFVLVHARPMIGHKYVPGSHGMMNLEAQFSSSHLPFVLQATKKDISVYGQHLQHRTVDKLFLPKTPVFMLGWPHYGCQGEVMGIEKSNGVRVRVTFIVPREPCINNAIQNQKFLAKQYYPGHIVSQRVGISTHFLSRITGTLYVQRGSREKPNENKVNVGLNLKFTKRNEEVPGYTRLSPEGWLYSERTVQLVSNYMKRFPEVWSYMMSKDPKGGDMFFEAELFANESSKLSEMSEYLKTLPCHGTKPVKTGSETLDERVIEVIEKEVEVVKPLSIQGTLIPDSGALFHLFDRVVNVRQGFPVPFGLRGTIVGIHPGCRDADTIYDIVFDEAFPGGITVRCSSKRGYRVPGCSLINLSHGEWTELGWRKNQGQTVARCLKGLSPRSKNSNALEYNRKEINQISPSRSHGSDIKNWQKNVCVSQHELSFQQKFGQSGSNTPQFMTPKMASRQTPLAKQQNRKWPFQHKQPEQGTAAEFADMWKELQLSNKGKVVREGQQDVSLQQAAKALGKLSSGYPTPVDSPPEPGSKHGSVTKLNLSNLFEQASKTSEQPVSELTENLANLDVSNKKMDDLTVVTNSALSSQESTAALKQILNIGSCDKKSGKSRGWYPCDEDWTEKKADLSLATDDTFKRQVTVEELFEGAKDQTCQKQPPGCHISPGHLQNKHSWKQQQHQKQRGPAPGYTHSSIQQPPYISQTSGRRNFVLELLHFCQSLGQTLPKYDFFKHPGHISACVTLMNGARFQGSMCVKREEAADSAACIALLHLQQASMMMPYHFMPPPPGLMQTAPQMGQHAQQFSSPNSAFSPVAPRVTPGSWGYQTAPLQTWHNTPLSTAAGASYQLMSASTASQPSYQPFQNYPQTTTTAVTNPSTYLHNSSTISALTTKDNAEQGNPRQKPAEKMSMFSDNYTSASPPSSDSELQTPMDSTSTGRVEQSAKLTDDTNLKNLKQDGGNTNVKASQRKERRTRLAANFTLNSMNS